MMIVLLSFKISRCFGNFIAQILKLSILFMKLQF